MGRRGKVGVGKKNEKLIIRSSYSVIIIQHSPAQEFWDRMGRRDTRKVIKHSQTGKLHMYI